LSNDAIKNGPKSSDRELNRLSQSATNREDVMATVTRMGRRPLSDDDRRDKPFRIRMTDQERKQVDLAAGSAGDRSSSRWARRVLLNAAARALARKQQRKS
jgi:hypothetical protein